MASTTFTNGVTLTDEDWFNDVDRLHYDILSDPADIAAVYKTINSLTADGSPDQDADYVASYDASATTGKKVLIKNLKQMAPITASLSGDVSLNNTANYFDGPTIAQGSTGTWFVSGTVTLIDTAGSSDFDVKLWDGTTVIASCETQSSTVGAHIAASLSGYLAAPAGNLRISVKDKTSTSGAIKFNLSGNSKDSTITAIRIA